MEPLTGDDPRRIGRYDVLGRIGSGGMGRVYLARSASGRQLAIKVVHRDYAESPEFRQRFGREIAAARAVGGFYTAAVVDADPDAEQPWLATEYVAGPSLEEFVREQGPLTGEPLRVLAVGLAEALAAIHAAGLVHRDFKPSNVLLAPDGPRVIDFGIARAFDATVLTATQHVVGTAGFMAPEQLTHGTVTAAADVFCLGLTLAFAATGRPPFGTGGMIELSFRTVNNEPDLAGLPAALTGVVGRCLAKDPAHRPVIREVLDALVGGGEAGARQDPSNPLAPTASAGLGAAPGPRRRMMPVAVSSAAAVVLAAGAVAWYVSDDKSSATGGSALTNNVAPTSQPVTAPPTTSLASNPASNPASGPTPDSTPASSPSTAPATVTVGSFAFPESQVLAEIYAQALTAKGVPVTRKFNIGAREVTDNLLRNGSVSVVPEYNGALLAYLDKAATARSTEDTDAALAAALPAGLEVLAPSPAQDNDALVVTAAVAAANKLKSVADLKRVAGTLVVGAAPEFQTRPQNGLPALNAAYGLKFKDFKALDNGGPLTVAALRDGTVQVADLYTTDSAVVTDHLVVLTDDKHVFGVQNVIPLVNKAGLPTAGADALNAVSAKLTTADLAQLMEQVEVEKKDMADVARTWLANAGLA